MSDPETEYQDDPRTACKYGESCYQKNPQHHSRFKHPPKRKLECTESEAEVSLKRRKTEILRISAFPCPVSARSFRKVFFLKMVKEIDNSQLYDGLFISIMKC